MDSAKAGIRWRNVKLRRRESGEETKLTPGLVVGRMADCALRLNDGSVSRRHARLELRGESWWVVDQGSSNGTFRNGERGQEFELRGGDLVTFGAVAFEFVGGAAATRAALPDLPDLDLGDEIVLEADPAAAVTSRHTPRPEPQPEPPSQTTRADQERARLRSELQDSKRSRGLGDLSQLSFGMQVLIALLGIGVMVGVVIGVRMLSATIAPTV
jgi:predicted component of type VI protein secretion system